MSFKRFWRRGRFRLTEVASAEKMPVKMSNSVGDNVTQIVLAVDHIIWTKLAEETYLCDEPVGTLNDWIQIQ